MKNRLEELRKARGIKQEELAEALEVSRQTIGSLENEMCIRDRWTSMWRALFGWSCGRIWRRSSMLPHVWSIAAVGWSLDGMSNSNRAAGPSAPFICGVDM